MINVAITGCTSFLGQYVVKELLNRDVKIFAIIRPESPYADIFKNIPNVTTIFSDMKNTQEWSAKIPHIDYFLHLGWDGSGVKGRADCDTQSQNVSCAVDTLCAAAKLGCKSFLFTGSQAEYGIHNDVITEETPCSPVTPYGKCKLEVFDKLSVLSKKHNIKYYHARVFSVFGVGDHPWTLISSCTEKLPKGESINLTSCNQYWNYIYASDAAKEIVSLLFSDSEGGIYNIASLDTRPLKEFVCCVHELCGKKGKLLFGEHTNSEGRVELKPDISKLLSAIGDFSFRPFDEGIREILASQI